MIKTTISQEIINYLKSHKGFIWGGVLERVIAIKTMSKPSNISRRLRELAEEGLIYKDYERIGRVLSVKYKGK